MPEVTIIGDATVDHFIFVNDGHIETMCKVDTHECEITLPFGEKIPAEMVEIECGGNGANISVGLSRLGVNIDPIIPLGKDIFSTTILGVLEKENVIISPALIDSKFKANSSFLLVFSGERTIFTHHEPKDYPVSEINSKFILYTSHSGNNNQLSAQVIAKMASEEKKLLFSPGNVHIKGDPQILEALLEKSYLLVCNLTEAKAILKKIGDMEVEPTRMLHSLNHHGVTHVVITDGANGVYYLDGENQTYDQLASVKDQKDIVDTTGAGDAMTTGVAYALIKGKSLEYGVRLGLQNSYSVLSFRGPQKGLLRKTDLKSI